MKRVVVIVIITIMIIPMLTSATLYSEDIEAAFAQTEGQQMGAVNGTIPPGIVKFPSQDQRVKIETLQCETIDCNSSTSSTLSRIMITGIGSSNKPSWNFSITTTNQSGLKHLDGHPSGESFVLRFHIWSTDNRSKVITSLGELTVGSYCLILTGNGEFISLVNLDYYGIADRGNWSANQAMNRGLVYHLNGFTYLIGKLNLSLANNTVGKLFVEWGDDPISLIKLQGEVIVESTVLGEIDSSEDFPQSLQLVDFNDELVLLYASERCVVLQQLGQCQVVLLFDDSLNVTIDHLISSSLYMYDFHQVTVSKTRLLIPNIIGDEYFVMNSNNTSSFEKLTNRWYPRLLWDDAILTLEITEDTLSFYVDEVKFLVLIEPEGKPHHLLYLEVDKSSIILHASGIRHLFNLTSLEGEVHPIRLLNITIDSDQDGIRDASDNCDLDSNANQSDIDNDGQGDVCDEDIDGDSILNQLDSCPMSIQIDDSMVINSTGCFKVDEEKANSDEKQSDNNSRNPTDSKPTEDIADVRGVNIGSVVLIVTVVTVLVCILLFRKL